MTRVRDFFVRRIRVLVVLGLSATWIALLGDLGWFLDLFSHFRLQYLACCVFAVAWFAWTKSRLGVAISLISLGINVAVITSVGGTKIGETDPSFRFRVASINVHSSNREAGRVLEFVRQTDADVVFLMEVDDWWEEALQPLKASYPHSQIQARADNFGVAFFSRLEIVESRIQRLSEPGDLTDSGVPMVVATMKQSGKAFLFIGAHPLPPAGRENSAWRDGQLRAIAQRVIASNGPALLVGDLNATPWSAGMRILTKGSALRLPPPSLVWSPTWMARSPLAIPIDHALAAPPLAVIRRDVGPDVGSDHRPIVVDVGWLR